MRFTKTIVLVGTIIVLVGGFVFWNKSQHNDKNSYTWEPTTVTRGSLDIFASAIGIVTPKNRIQIQPNTAGRIDSVEVVEGQNVHKGQKLIEMSSQERATLLDSAQSKGKDAVKYWSQIYKPIEIVAPISGQIIVSKMNPGQSVALSDVLLVLSDQLIVQGQVDETDVRKIKVGQVVSINLDAYPKKDISGKVVQIFYEAEVVNNITVYQVNVVVDNMPNFFRSGMNANLNILVTHKDDVLLIPNTYIDRAGKRPMVWVRNTDKDLPHEKPVKLGQSDGEKTEVLKGLEEGDKIYLQKKKTAGKGKGKQNPLMFSRGKSDSARSSGH